ncbi:MAG: hypothetical protein ACLU5F_04280 [Anaerovoracaceae bacterium]
MNTFKDRAIKITDQLMPDLEELALKIHANPEIGLEEEKACAWQVDLLKKYGFEVETPYAGFDTAYRAVYKGRKAGPKIAMLAEYDALPEIGHGCGHNLIATQMEKLGAVVKRTHGEYTPGSSDMGDVSYRCPAVQSTFDINSGRGAIAHTREFTQCAGSPEGIQAARRVICGFVMTAAELMSNPTYLKEIKHEFENMTR